MNIHNFVLLVNTCNAKSARIIYLVAYFSQNRGETLENKGFFHFGVYFVDKSDIAIAFR